MRKRGTVVFGLVVFLALGTFPFWYARAVGGARAAAAPDVELPTNATRCVEDTQYMIANHMELLNQWRDAVVRDGQSEYTSHAFGTPYEMSLTKTCLSCHQNILTFCDRCHAYADVEPRCWDCHVEPRGH
jgi:hypothetical protein